MEKTRKPRKPVSAETIARMADQGKDVSRFFTNTGRMMGPIQRVNVDLTAGMLEELDIAAKELNISRQAVIKTLIRQALDRLLPARPRSILSTSHFLKVFRGGPSSAVADTQSVFHAFSRPRPTACFLCCFLPIAGSASRLLPKFPGCRFAPPVWDG